MCAGMGELEWLSVKGAFLDDLRPLEGLDKLATIDIRECLVDGYAPDSTFLRRDIIRLEDEYDETDDEVDDEVVNEVMDVDHD
jgi:hypothetical protein